MELYLFISDACNFKCEHCIASSDSTSKRFVLTQEEMNKVIREVNENENISQVHFSGGEASLHEESMILFQNSVSRPIKYSITTNGSFYKRAKSFFTKIHLDEICLSYDKYHAPFISKEALKEVISEALLLNIRIVLRYTYEKLEELAEAKELLFDERIIFSPGTVLLGGRQKEFDGRAIGNHPLKSECPSLDRKNTEGEREIYMPNRGYTPCCGQLAFDEQASDNFLYSNKIRDSKLLHELNKGPFEEQLKKAKLVYDHMDFKNPCEICSFLYKGREYFDNKSLFELSTNKKTFNFKMPEEMPPSSIFMALTKTYSQKIIFVADKISIEDVPHQNNFTVSYSNDENTISEVIKLYDKIYFSKFETMLPHCRDEDFAAIRNYSTNAKVVTISKGSTLYGVLFLRNYEKFPLDDFPALNIGLIGYDKEQLSSDEQRAIKKIIVDEINKEQRPGQKITVPVDFFNPLSLKFHAKLGFRPVSLYMVPV